MWSLPLVRQSTLWGQDGLWGSLVWSVGVRGVQTGGGVFRQLGASVADVFRTWRCDKLWRLRWQLWSSWSHTSYRFAQCESVWCWISSVEEMRWHKCQAQSWPARCEKMHDCLAIQVRAVLKYHQLQQQVIRNDLDEESWSWWRWSNIQSYLLFELPTWML